MKCQIKVSTPIELHRISLTVKGEQPKLLSTVSAVWTIGWTVTVDSGGIHAKKWRGSNQANMKNRIFTSLVYISMGRTLR